MSRSQGVLYHILPTVNTRRGWKETESSNPPDCIYEGEIENGLPHGIDFRVNVNGQLVRRLSPMTSTLVVQRPVSIPEGILTKSCVSM